jgi:hypothetical protein
MMKAVGLRIIAVCGLFVVVSAAFAQEKPGAEHALLKQMEGTWDGTVKMAGEPGKPAAESKGAITYKMDLGGFFLFSEFKGDMMGQSFTGKGMTGYDPKKKKYFGTWADSMGPTMMILEGSFDKDGKTLTEIGEGPDMTGNLTKYKLVTQIKDKDTIAFAISTVGKDGKDQPIMTIDYKRKK